MSCSSRSVGDMDSAGKCRVWQLSWLCSACNSRNTADECSDGVCGYGDSSASALRSSSLWSCSTWLCCTYRICRTDSMASELLSSGTACRVDRDEAEGDKGRPGSMAWLWSCSLCRACMAGTAQEAGSTGGSGTAGNMA